MPTPQAHVRLDPGLIESARRKIGLPDDASSAQIIRAAFLRFLGQADADGDATWRGGPRPRQRELADR